jgi:glycosyltransferase involved in cell wall biosynthesis
MIARSPLRRIDLWVPEIHGPGGIQHHSRTLLRELQEVLPAARIRVFSKNQRGISLPLRTVRFSALLAARTIADRPDLAILTHLHFAPVAHALRRLVGLRYWVAAHGIEAWDIGSTLTQRALAEAEKILPVSSYTAQRLIQSQPTLERSRFFPLPNAVDETTFYPTAKPPHLLNRYGLAKNQKVLFTLARLSSHDRYKGHDLVLDGLGRLGASIPGLHYILAGHGDDTERIRRRIKKLRLQSQVTLTGFLPERELRDHYNLCDLFVMPSAREGFGVVFLEALACGKPVVAGGADGSRDLFLDGDLGAFADGDDPEVLAQTIKRLLDADENGEGASRTLHRRDHVIERFGRAAFQKRLRSLLPS